jgi:hypothetical protein
VFSRQLLWRKTWNIEDLLACPCADRDLMILILQASRTFSLLVCFEGCGLLLYIWTKTGSATLIEKYRLTVYEKKLTKYLLEFKKL